MMQRHLLLFSRCTLLIALSLVLWPMEGAAQATATFRTIVTSNEDGRSLPGANVVLTALASDTRYAGATNVDGYHQTTGIAPGRYALAVSFVGFETHRDTLTFAADERRTLSIVLSVQEQTLDEVRVEAERGAARRQAGLQTVGSADLERIPTPGPTGDLASYLRTLPGIVSAGDRGGQLYVRGGTPSQNLILVDDIPVINPFHISSLYSAFPQEIIRHVDVYAGGYSAEYMGAVSSAIDVTLRRGNMKRFAGSAALGPFLTSARLEGPLEVGQQSFLGVARYSVIEQTSSALLGEPTPMQFYDMTGRYSLQTENVTCNVTGLYTHDRGRINTDRNTTLSWSNTALGGSCFMFGSGIDHAVDLSAGYTHFENAAGSSANPERTASVRRVYLGVDSQLNVLSLPIDFGLQFTVWQHEARLGEKFVSLDFLQQNGGAVEAYAALDWTPSDYLTVTPSIGTQMADQRIRRPTYEPRLRLAYRPNGTDRQEISLALGKYNQVSEAITDKRDAGTVFTAWKVASASDPLLEALHGILGYRQRIGSALEASVEGYVKNLSNIPVPRWTPEARFNTETTVANGLAYGMDVRLEYQKGPFYSYLGYGWSKVTYEAANEDLGAWADGTLFSYAPAHDRRHQLNAVASYEVAGFTTNVSWELGTGRPYTKILGFDLALDLPEQYPTTSPGTARTLFHRPYGARMPVTHRLDVSVDRSFDLHARLALETKIGAINAYDRNNVFYYDINTFQRVDQAPLLPYLSLRVVVE